MARRTSTMLAIACTVVLGGGMLAGAPAAADTGDLVPSFGTNGRLLLPITPKVDTPPGEMLFDVLRVSSTRFRTVSFGYFPSSYPGGDRGGFVTLRAYRGNGSVDPTFNSGKPRRLKVINSLQDDSTGLADAATDAQGRTYLLTTADHTGFYYDGTLYRVSASGALETGYTRPLAKPLPAGLPDSSADADRFGLAVRSDGRAWVCIPGRDATYVAALTPAGELDAAYGTGEVPGYAVMPRGSDERRRCGTLAVDAAGAAYVATDVTPPGGTLSQPGVVKLDASGTPQTAWGAAAGVTLTTPGYSLASWTLAVSKSGALYLAGTASVAGPPAAHRPFVARIRADGTVDTAFGSAGVRVYNLVGRRASGLAVGASNRLYVSVEPTSYSTPRPRSILRVIATTGGPDTAFPARTYKAARTEIVVRPLTSTRVLIGSTSLRTGGAIGPWLEMRRA